MAASVSRDISGSSVESARCHSHKEQGRPQGPLCGWYMMLREEEEEEEAKEMEVEQEEEEGGDG